MATAVRATAAGGAALVYVIYHFLPDLAALALVLGALTTIALRLSSRWLGLRLPMPRAGG